MSDYFLIAGGVMLILIPICLIIWLVQAVRKKETKKTKLICLCSVVLFLVFEAVGMVTRCRHEWQEATCVEPKTCSLCGEIEGELLEHAWVEATCTEPRTCSVCGETNGSPLGHTWKEATCAAPTCDPQLEPSEAAEIAREALISTVDGAGYIKNGIAYVFGAPDGQWSFVFSLKNA